jgi:hypothetical protein
MLLVKILNLIVLLKVSVATIIFHLDLYVYFGRAALQPICSSALSSEARTFFSPIKALYFSTDYAAALCDGRLHLQLVWRSVILSGCLFVLLIL